MTEVLYENPDVLNQDPWQLPLEDLNPAQPELFAHDRYGDYFARLREQAPVHYCRDSAFGPYWSITKYLDIKYVNTHNELFSSEPNIVLQDQAEDFKLPMFIAMDPPKHDQQRKEVAAVAGPRNLAALEPTIRGRVCQILDSLPVGEQFDWVDRVSIELTTQMLATLFDFPFDERRKLTRWSDVATAAPMPGGIVESVEQRQSELRECLERFTQLWNERVNAAPGNDLVSMLAHGESTKNMHPMEYLGNLVLLIVGGNDTTRNSISGGVLALNQNPEQYRKLREQPELIPNMVSEMIRWQTPLAYMRRRVLEDTEVGGQTLRAGEKVAMWYVSGNRDPDMFDDPDAFRIDRPNARKHIAFGFGIHRCMGNRVAEMQLRVLWEEILKRFHTVEVVGEPVRVPSSFVKGYLKLPVVLHPV